jgi:tetratricopeptide (TPR) repeat protein
MRQAAVNALARGDWRHAAENYRKLLEVAPESADDWFNLAYSLRRIGEFEAALEAYRHALERGVDRPEEVHLNRAVILTDELYREGDAEAELRQALALQPDYAPALLNLGNLLEEQGKRAEALACYQRLQEPGEGEPSTRFEALARMAHLDPPDDPADPRLDVLARAAESNGIDAALSANLWLALARACDRLGAHERAFAAMEAGKRAAAMGAAPYRAQRFEALIDSLIDQFQAATQAKVPIGSGGPRPVFVCGMYRSGSTLIEQILSVHSDVVAGGELGLLPRLIARHLPAFPRDARRLGDEAAQDMADRYLEQVRARLPALEDGLLFTDKHPPNFLFIGLILRIFPNARIVHTRRHPLDTILSIYMQNLEPRLVPYACRLEDTAHYYIHYRRLMAHWQRLYPGQILDVHYDQLVAAPEEVLRGLLGFLGLEWDARCLAFHRSKATVRTASYWQVRQPLYSSASGRWKRYRPHLEAVRRRLDDAGLLDGESSG